MNVGYVCKTFPAYLPHELFGYSRDSLAGMLLTTKIVEKINEEEQKQVDSSSSHSGQAARIRKFKSRK